MAVALLNLGVLAAQFRALIYALYRNPDTASGAVLAALAGGNHQTTAVTLGDYHYYEAWWLDTATHGLPGRWQIWEAIPFVIAFCGIALMAWAAWRVLGAFAAVLTTVLMLSLGDAMRWMLFTATTHGFVVAHAALLVAAMVLVMRRSGRAPPSWGLLALVGAPLATLSAVAGTDQLFQVVFLPAFALAGCVVLWRMRNPPAQRVAVFCAAVCAAGIVGAQLLDHVMRSQHVASQPFPISFVSPAAILSNLQTTVVSLAALGGGSFFGAPVSGTALLIFAVGIAALLGVLAVLRLIWRYALSLGEQTSAPVALREFYVSFWALVVSLSLAAYVLSGLPVAEGDVRYLPGVYAGVAALLPLLAGRLFVRRAAIAFAVGVFAVLIATNHLVEGASGIGAGVEAGVPTPSVAYEILGFVGAKHAYRGYAPYYVAPVVTWETRAALKAYAVEPCGSGLCPFPFNQSSTWYRPTPGARTFLIADSVELPGNFAGAPSTLGPPVATATFGEYTVYVYGYDIAAKLG